MRDLQTIDSAPCQMVGTSAALRQLERDIQLAARCDMPVLVTGEHGVGKQLVAACIHETSGRAAAGCSTIRCSSAAGCDLWRLESGNLHVASSDVSVVLQCALRGTAVLVEPDEMSDGAQAALARCFETGELRTSVDGPYDGTPNVRLITSNRCRLYERLEAGHFTDALFYRLNVIHIRVPPLRERIEDVPVLLAHFFRLFSQTHDAPLPELSSATLAMLTQYEWPGNVHEVRRLAEGLVVRGLSTIVLPQDLPPELVASISC